MWGSMFSRRSGEFDRRHLAPVELAALRHEAGAVELPWGRWAAAAVSPDGRELFLGRDPLGLGRIFYLIGGAGSVIFSTAVRFLAAVGDAALAPDWAYLTGRLQGSVLPPDRTSFAGVCQIKPGAVRTFTAGGITEHTVWNPARIAEEPVTEVDLESLSATFEQCVTAWLGEADRAWIELSGGLDSSAVLWAAARSGRETIGVHSHDPRSAAGDELKYARAASEHVGTELRVVDIVPLESTLETFADLNELPEFSVSQFLYPQMIRQYTDLIAPDRRVLNGIGGDQLFCAMLPNNFELHDSFRHDKKNFLRQVLGTSRWQGTPVVPLLAAVAAAEFRLLRGRLLEGVLPHVNAYEPVPWIDASSFDKLTEVRRRTELAGTRLPAGKISQILAITLGAAIPLEQTLFDAFTQISPMYSQPLVELTLRIRTTDLLAPHCDRVSFRTAMRTKLPDAIVDRVDKGETSNWHARTIANNAATIKELVGNGAAVAAGVVETEGAMAALRAASAGKTTDLRPLLELVAMELWHRQLWG
jgi:asparagine synthase (glutamine-hydrolysing)